MVSVSDIMTFLNQFAPLPLAEDWDNVGLLLGDRLSQASRIMTCLTLTPDVAAEAIEEQANLIVSHHPILFRPVSKLTSDSVEGSMVLQLISAGISVYSPHTSYDSAQAGINQQLAELLELTNINVLRPQEAQSSEATPEPLGAGRFGDLAEPVSLKNLNDIVKQALGISHLQYVGQPNSLIKRIGIACGSAVEFLPGAVLAGCDVLLTGEARFHALLEARAEEIALILPGHYATERPAMETLAKTLEKQFDQLTIWASEQETDPLKWD